MGGAACSAGVAARAPLLVPSAASRLREARPAALRLRHVRLVLVSLMVFGPRARFQSRIALGCQASFLGTRTRQRLAAIIAAVCKTSAKSLIAIMESQLESCKILANFDLSAPDTVDPSLRADDGEDTHLDTKIFTSHEHFLPGATANRARRRPEAAAGAQAA